jgi:hypothetical protein
MMNVRLNILFDYYGELLTDKQQEIFQDYYFDNLTMQEIADNNEVSKNAVHKTLNTIVNKLEYYEEKLKLYDKSLKIRDLVSDLDEVTKEKIYDLI